MAETQRKKKNSGKYSRKNRARPILWVLIVVLSALLIGALVLVWNLRGTVSQEEPTVPTVPAVPTEPPTEPSVPNATVEQVQESDISMGYGLNIIQVGKYTGAYMEDGTDDDVSGVLMLVVKNTSQSDIQYAEVILAASDTGAFFDLYTLPAGETAVLLERTRMQWSAEETYANAMLDNVTVFQEPLSLCPEQLKLEPLEGMINVTNISGADITGEIVICYKSRANGMYYGGITYEARIEGGLAAGESQQIIADHFYRNGSEILFVTIG